MRSHYTMEQWDYFIEGNMPAAQKQNMEQHMVGCEKCRMYYEALVQLKDKMERQEKTEDNFYERVMEMVDKNKYQNRRKSKQHKKGIRVLKPVVTVVLVMLFAGLSYYFGSKYGMPEIPERNVAEQPTEITPAGTTAEPTVNERVITLTLYFPNSNADCVVPKERQVRITEGESIEKVIFEELQKGPEADGKHSMIPEGTQLLSVETREGICYLDLSSEFVDNNPGGTAFESLLIGSIVNALTELPEVNKVQFLINGETREVYTHAIFNEPFERMESLIRTPENTSEAIEEKVRATGIRVLETFRDQDMERLAAMVHPDKGVRLTPYSYVDKTQDRVLSANEVKEALKDATKHLWGVYDGIGDPIELTFADYMVRFIYDVDFVEAPEVGYNRSIAVGNTLNNIYEAYPEGIVVEYYFPGFDPEFAGMDWRSLRLVFEEKEGSWYLVGVVHDEWTI